MEQLFYYNILWIDDEHEGLSSTKGIAKVNGINLVGFKSLNAGVSEIEQNCHYYDGVLLDAKFFENEDDLAGSEDTDNIHRAKERLLQLKKKFEIFVFTGQAEAFEDKTFNKAFRRVYKKGSTEERDRLFNDIKIAANQQIETQIRHKYNRAFVVCTNKYIGVNTTSTLLSLLKSVEGNEDIFNTEDKLNAVRKVVEKLFVALNRIGVIPDEVCGITNQSKFLAGQSSNYTFTENILDSTTAYLLKSILDITQDASHSKKDLKLKVDEHIKQQDTPYLFNSVVFQLLDVLIWFKKFADSHPDIEKNKLIAIPLEVGTNSIYEGIIEKDSNNNYFCGIYLLNKTYTEKKFKVGDQIKITEESDNTTLSKHLYPKYTKTFIKITS